MTTLYGGMMSYHDTQDAALDHMEIRDAACAILVTAGIDIWDADTEWRTACEIARLERDADDLTSQATRDSCAGGHARRARAPELRDAANVMRTRAAELRATL